MIAALSYCVYLSKAQMLTTKIWSRCIAALFSSFFSLVSPLYKPLGPNHYVTNLTDWYSIIFISYPTLFLPLTFFFKMERNQLLRQISSMRQSLFDQVLLPRPLSYLSIHLPSKNFLFLLALKGFASDNNFTTLSSHFFIFYEIY